MKKHYLTFPQLMYSTAVSLKKKYTKLPCTKEFTKSGAVNNKYIIIRLYQSSIMLS